jgi:S-formylglutathione hydrolase FrmB
MLKHKVEELPVNTWKYERYHFKSAVLGQDLHCGFLRPPESIAITKTLYMFHGGSADDTQAVQAGLLPHFVSLLKNQPVQIAFPNIGTSFLHDHPTEPQKSFSNYFLKEIIPNAEHGTATQERYLCGWSMGGQAALNMFARHPDRFGGVGVHFPTLIPFNYLDNAEAAAYAKRQNITATMLETLVTEFKKEFIDFKDFKRHDPLSLARDKGSQWQNKKIYFDVGSEDEFGLSEGAQALHEILLDKKVDHYFKVIPQGKHDGPFIYTQIENLFNYLR